MYLLFHNTHINKYIVDLKAIFKEGRVLFSIPLQYYTRYWKKEQVGNITYYFRDKLNKENAQLFVIKNRIIAEKFGLQPEDFEFYLTDNYQEILQLRGFRYSVNANGDYMDGYGVVDNTIFAVGGNEDFSHDLVHYYSKKVNNNRNWLAEEGTAYLWGNAYYNQGNGHTISMDQLHKEFTIYMKNNPDKDIQKLFIEDENIMNHISPYISIRSFISSIIIDTIEQKHGKNGVLQLINSGNSQPLNNFLTITNELIDFNKENFESEIRKYLQLED
ncbi:hypothetical protein QYS48_29005 [Marivirga arenosa]|uniref:Uncharacterized protein n=1 Tax=Marivirga arenosa TaxID=3059076 RepID=A0AA51N733_9BACT|nr:hypothetical protein [Marivirga sp. ABR2-2]WMN07511.1 hypothetical protein QYS48_29005 [Marivirga sp. ABR2-2]